MPLVIHPRPNPRFGPRVFSVDHEAVQIDWAGQPRAPASLSVGGARAVVDDASRPCVVRLPLLDGGASRASVVVGAQPPVLDQLVAPLQPPPGAELIRFATVNDLHLGAPAFDYANAITEDPPPAEPHWLRCARASIGEALAWGAELLVVKGDLTHVGHRWWWRAAAALLGDLPVPVHIVPGNHDTHPSAGRIDPYTALDGTGLHLVQQVEVVDLPGLRVVLANTTTPNHGRGRLAHLRDDLCDAVAEARRAGVGVLLAGHHQVNPAPFPTYWPNGIAKAEGEAVLGAVHRAHADVVYACGHTHRHRRRTVSGLQHVEVGSTKDHPGTWAGYVVHEAGIVQTVRRIEADDCQAWLARTAGAAGGLWGRWSPGSLSDRCFTVAWGGR
jgi:3',5'-cyclic-AMP phosphodiesterase